MKDEELDIIKLFKEAKSYSQSLKLFSITWDRHEITTEKGKEVIIKPEITISYE